MKAVIIAAGCGSRLESQHRGIPKTLLKIGAQSIIDIIISGITGAGVNDVVVVTGYKSEILEKYLKNSLPDSVNLEFCFNPSWELSNGVSVLCAEKLINKNDEFLLLMSDHIFETEMLEVVIDTPIEKDQALLALDFKLGEIPDLDDGMKIKCTRIDKDRFEITGLDKSFEDYQAIDCGMFKLNYDFFSVLRKSIEQGKDSLSDACNHYTKKHKMIGVDIHEKLWIDLDTPEMFAFEKRINIITGKVSP